ncbi:MAG: hypothetical protein MUF62_12350 [Chitinophagaceae bacterium]|nr:hypothetical protein [Chitinophagaceae bacterium]
MPLSTPAYFVRHPRRLLLLDAAGALSSAAWLGLLLPLWQAWVGLPARQLHALAVVAIGLALANALYAVATTVLLIAGHAQLHWLGWLYFGAELLVLLVLIRWEWREAGAKH